jgi:hypothetical protein
MFIQLVLIFFETKFVRSILQSYYITVMNSTNDQKFLRSANKLIFWINNTELKISYENKKSRRVIFY